MSTIDKITDHWTETVSEYILEQYKEATNWKAILKSVIDQFSDVEENIWKLAPILDFKCRVKGEIPTGTLLDFVAGILNVERNVGESDEDFYERFLSESNSDDSGTPDNILYNAALMSKDPRPRYFDEAPATFFIYTPNGRQLKRAQVKKLAPTGVLGLPGAAIRLGNGKHWRGVDGKKILCVAQDTRRYVTAFVVDEQGRFAVNESGVRVVAVLE